MKAEDITDWDSYYAMLKAFTEQDPDGNGKNDTYGVAAAGFIGSEAPYTNYLPQFWQNAYPSFTYDENGVWYDGFNTQETKDALLRLQQAYADGVIDPESLTMGTKDVRENGGLPISPVPSVLSPTGPVTGTITWLTTWIRTV